MLMLNVYKVFVVKTEPRLHFGVQCNVNVGSSGGCWGENYCIVWDYAPYLSQRGGPHGGWDPPLSKREGA